MFKITNKLFIFIIILFALSACNYKGVNITKRHYSKGNYISVNKKNATHVMHEKDKNNSSNVEIKLPAIANKVNVEKDALIAEASTNSNIKIEDSNNLNDFAALVNTAENNKITEKHRSEDNAKLHNSTKLKKLLHISKVQKDDEARSLFWLVISVLVIIWLIALVSGGWGLGGLVNILLLVALILFILWLLRLI